MARGCFLRCKDKDAESTGGVSTSEVSRWEPSTSTGATRITRTSSDSHVLWKGHGQQANKLRRLSSAWCDDAYIMDQCNGVQTIIEEASQRRLQIPTPELAPERRRTPVEDVIYRLRRMRQEMEDGIEEMQCQMYQIRFCSHALKKERGEKQAVAKSFLDRHSPMTHKHQLHARKPPSERIPSARDTFYESSGSGRDHSPDDCSVMTEQQKPYLLDRDVCSVSPVHTPLLRSTEMGVSVSPSVDEAPNKHCEVSELPVPEISAFQMSPSAVAVADESVQGILRNRDDSDCLLESNEEPASARVHAYPCRGLKTDVVLNLQSPQPPERPLKPMETPTQAPKESTLDKFLGLFCRGKIRCRGKSAPPCGTIKPKAQTFKLQSLTPRPRHQRRLISSQGCKFTDKYPIGSDEEDSQEMQECFCSALNGRNVEFESECWVTSRARTQRNFVLSADGIANGIACFDVTCLQLKGWCFIGVLDKSSILSSQGTVSVCRTSHGWSNEGQCFRDGVPYYISGKEPFKAGTNFQLVVNAEAGTLHFRFPKEQLSERQEYVEHEISALPRNVEWSLVIEWDGPGGFELNSVQSWQ